MTQIINLSVEHRSASLGIGMADPRLSWRVETDIQGWRQAGYEIKEYAADGKLFGQTGRIDTERSVLVDWPFAPLQSRERVALRVRVWGQDGSASPWSEFVSVEAGLLAPQDWSAHFITPDWDEDVSISNPAPYLRRDFELGAGIQSARLYITALGVYEAEVNGQVVSDHVFAPGWTVYDQRLRYQTFDVTGMLQTGKNAIGVVLGDGWFRGRLGFGGGQRNIYGERLALLAQLEVQYRDGSTEHILTDKNWQAATGPILTNSIYDGETYDARLEHDGWSSPDFDASDWHGVRFLEWDEHILQAPLGPPVRRTETVTPVSISPAPSGKTIVDFGQNLVGRVVLKVRGPAGHTVTLRHAEVLENGELCTRPLRFAEATERYTLKGSEAETWEPRFTFHGFRYVEVNNWPGELRLDDLRAVVIHSDMQRSGWFESSDPLLNQLHQNVVWGMRGNFLDVPTDCPQRDERLGWTGDLQVFSPTACFIYDVSGFLQMSIQPRPGGGLTYAQVRHLTPYGMAESAWKIEDGTFDLHVLIPPNTTALVTLPGDDATPIKVGSGTWHWSLPYRDPDVRGPCTVDDLIGDITYDPAARDALMNVLQQVGAPDFLMRMLLNERNVPLREALWMLSNHEKAVELMNKALANL